MKFFDNFMKPLVGVFKLDVNDGDSFVAALEAELSGATDYQLSFAAKSIIRARKSRYFPSIAECVEAVAAAPDRDWKAERERLAPVVHNSAPPPILVAARQYLFEYGQAAPARRKRMDQTRPHYLAACKAVVSAWERPDPGHRSESEADRAARVARLISGARVNSMRAQA